MLHRRTFASLSVFGLAAVLAVPAFGATRILETGSSLLYPLMNIWVKAYDNKDVEITTQSTGSGAGISQAIAGVAQIGASDAYVSDGQMAKAQVLNIPLAISAQQINYNVPEIGQEHLTLSGPILAGVYDGSIRFWDDAKIKDLNKSLGAKLPHKNIIPVRRSDGSGDTFLFTQFLSDTTPSWKSAAAYGTTISWPSVPNEVGATGNTGMLQAAKGTPYAIAYIGVSYIDESTKAGLGYAGLVNANGKTVLPTEKSIRAAADENVSKTPADERISMINSTGNDSYPIVNYEYAVVSPMPQGGTADALKKFLTWAVSADGGQKSEYLGQVHFVALPGAIASKSKEQIGKIK